MIDAHVHLWRIGRNDCRWPTAAEPAIHRDVEAPELLRLMAAAGIAGALLVQSQESARDTAWLLDVAEREPELLGVVGWADLADLSRVTEAAEHPMLRGLRPMAQDRADDWYDDPAIDAGLARMAGAGLVLDALVRPRHLPSLERLARRHPGLAVVVDHGAKPDIATGRPGEWREALARLAACPNVHCKLSGLLTERGADQPSEAVVPYANAVLDLFGTERTIWGSDWPVLTLAGDYHRWLAMALALVAEADWPAVFGGNAARVYRLDAAA